jgi:predicted CopG family antitoxin
MRLEELFEAISNDPEKRLVIVYGGRFQPFHRGHYQVYLWLCKKYGKGNVWIATSNKTNYKEEDGPISPFTFNEKVEIMSGLYGIEARRIVQCKNPAFSPKEVFKLYKGFKLVYAAAVGHKDEDRYKESKHFLPIPRDLKLPSNVDQLMDIKEDRAYYTVVPMKRESLSGSEVREQLIAAEDHEQKKVFTHCFGKYDDTIADLVITRLKEMK